MPIDVAVGGDAETAIISAITNGLLTVYATTKPDAAEMDKLARAITPGIIAALRHIKDNADLAGVAAGTDTVAGGVD